VHFAPKGALTRNERGRLRPKGFITAFAHLTFASFASFAEKIIAQSKRPRATAITHRNKKVKRNNSASSASSAEKIHYDQTWQMLTGPNWPGSNFGSVLPGFGWRHQKTENAHPGFDHDKNDNISVVKSLRCGNNRRPGRIKIQRCHGP